MDLYPTSTPGNNNNLFTISVDAASASGQTINFAMLSLFPPTFKNRPNGMRVDLAEVRVMLIPWLICILIAIVIGFGRNSTRFVPVPRWE